jgi:ATP-dependent Clp protease adapter protein ClpS
MPGPDGNPFAQPDGATSTILEHGWKVVLFNDDVTPFDLVILALQKICALSEEVAEMVALEAHEQGRAVARSGLTQDEAEATCVKMKALTRIPRLCPGVSCAAEQDG